MASPDFKILSIDGGGIRGVIPCTILSWIEEQTGSSISKLFNVIAGTSTGGIIALGLTMPGEHYQNAFSASDMLNLYVDHGKEIFSARSKDLLSWISGKLFNKTYSSENMENLLDEYFKDSKLKDSLTNLLITTYELEKGRPFYFSSRLAQTDDKENISMKEIARSTSAAPTYFKPSVVRYDDKDDLAFVDGGVFANNPSILAYSEGKEIWKQRQAKHPEDRVLAAKGFDAVVTADDFDMPFYQLSIGTGYTANKLKMKDAEKFRNKDWIEPLLTNIFMRSVAESTHFTMQHLLPPYTDGTPRYTRLNFEIPVEHSEMDDTSDENIESLVKAAKEYISTHKKELEEVCEIIG